MVISADFATMISGREGTAGREWIDRLPAIVDDLLARWTLGVDGVPRYGMCAVVLPVRAADGVPGALKVSWIDDETRAEPVALRAWAGRGAVAVRRCDDAAGAMLLERLDADRVLTGVPIGRALEVAGSLLAGLRVPAVPGLRDAGELAARWGTEFPAEWARLGRPCDVALLDTAVERCAELSVPIAHPVLLHGDFHYGNVLGRGDDDWAVIDPKPLAGDPAFEVVPLLRNRWAEFGGDLAKVRRLGGSDPARTFAWCLIRSVDDALWFQENGYGESAETSWDIARTMHRELSG